MHHDGTVALLERHVRIYTELVLKATEAKLNHPPVTAVSRSEYVRYSECRRSLHPHIGLVMSCPHIEFNCCGNNGQPVTVGSDRASGRATLESVLYSRCIAGTIYECTALYRYLGTGRETTCDFNRRR